MISGNAPPVDTLQSCAFMIGGQAVAIWQDGMKLSKVIKDAVGAVFMPR